MPYADPAVLDFHIIDILNAAVSWGGVISAGIRHPDEIANARKQACLEVLGAISRNPAHGYFGDLAALVSVAHNSFLPAHDGEIGTPKIIPFAGATAREAIPADPDEIDSYRNNPAAYTGALDGIVIPHDQPNANRVEGAIVTAVLGDGGAGYEVGDTGTIDAGDGLAAYEVLTVVGGVVETFQLTNRGSNYAAADGVATINGGAQPGIGAGLTQNVLSVGSTGTGAQSPLSCRFSIVSSYFKFTGLSAQVPMMIITEAMRDTKIPLRLGPAVVKRAIPKLVKPGDALALIAGAYGAEGTQDLMEIAGGAMSVPAVKAVPDIVAAIKQN
jgi:hypothetical protein